jgi:hypothetical protein
MAFNLGVMLLTCLVGVAAGAFFRTPPQAVKATPTNVETQMVEIPDPCLSRSRRGAHDPEPTSIVVVTIKDSDGNTYRIECR